MRATEQHNAGELFFLPPMKTAMVCPMNERQRAQPLTIPPRPGAQRKKYNTNHKKDVEKEEEGKPLPITKGSDSLTVYSSGSMEGERV